MTTLADMTPEQRAQCAGMWCYVYDPIRDGMEPEPPTGEGIIVGYTEPNAGGNAIIYHPHPNAPTWSQPLNEIEPRGDLPRAWQADGSPVEMDVEGADYRPGTNRGFYTLDETIQKGRELPEGTTRARRFVGEWEEE